jgi:hypothetical protein
MHTCHDGHRNAGAGRFFRLPVELSSEPQTHALCRCIAPWRCRFRPVATGPALDLRGLHIARCDVQDSSNNMPRASRDVIHNPFILAVAIAPGLHRAQKGRRDIRTDFRHYIYPAGIQ